MRHIARLSCLFFLLFGSLQAKSAPNTAPEFEEINAWINSKPVKINALRGKVVLVDFWSYSCINCLRTLPHRNRWYDTYKDKGFVIIGIHSPEFHFEYDVENVQMAVKRYGIHYPVGLDNQFSTWHAYKTRYWPTSYLIDQQGRIRYRHIGEGSYFEMENAIRALLGMQQLTRQDTPKPKMITTSEIYLGTRRAQSYSPTMTLKTDTINLYNVQLPLGKHEVGLVGKWRVAADSVTSVSSNCKILLNCLAGKVHVVLSGTSNEPIRIMLDGKALPEKYYTSDMDSDGEIFMDGDRKYDIADFQGEMKQATLSISLPPGISAFTFTFGE